MNLLQFELFNNEKTLITDRTSSCIPGSSSYIFTEQIYYLIIELIFSLYSNCNHQIAYAELHLKIY